MKRSKPEQTRDSRARNAGILVFALALSLRLFFWQATPDRDLAYSPYYKGDAPTWLRYAAALQQDQPFELGLPLRPPGAGYLVAWLWNGQRDGIATLRFAWCLMGALTALLIYGATRRSFGLKIALITGLLSAASTGLMVLSTSLDNETPYLLLVAAALFFWQPVREQPRAGPVIGWSMLNALACLVRVEHVLFFALATAHLVIAWYREGKDHRGLARRLALSLGAFVLVLLPWQLHATSSIQRFNQESIAANAATEQAYAQLEQALAFLEWTPEAEAERERLPACCRRAAAGFVAATVAVRGGREVDADDFRHLDDAFGVRPEPIAEHPFLVIYGGLNFALANNAAATGGFERSLLDRAPPLIGGASRYPAMLIQGLPPAQLTFTYPPHLEIVNHGYRMGWQWIRANPRDSAELAAHKLARFWHGAALGLGGYNLPMGLSGMRRAVDMVVPESSPGVTAWRVIVLLVTVLGIAAGWRREPLIPWLLFLASKLAVTVAFYGYARHGATVIPVLSLLAALAAVRWIPLLREEIPWTTTWRAGFAVTTLLVVVEGGRWMSQPEVALDGRTFASSDPFPIDDHTDRALEIR